MNMFFVVCIVLLCSLQCVLSKLSSCGKKRNNEKITFQKPKNDTITSKIQKIHIQLEDTLNLKITSLIPTKKPATVRK